MEKPRFKIPEKKSSRTGRIMIFLCSVAAVSYLLVSCSMDYMKIFEMNNIQLTAPTRLVLTSTQFIATYWWIIAAATLIITLIFYLLLKSGTIYTLLSIIVWFAGLSAYAILWISNSALDKSTGG